MPPLKLNHFRDGKFFAENLRKETGNRHISVLTYIAAVDIIALVIDMKDLTILQGNHFLMKNSDGTTYRLVMDYELDFDIKGERKMFIDDISYPILKNSLIFRRPGQKVRSYGDYDCYMLTVDSFGREINSAYSRNHAAELQAIYSDKMLDLLPNVFVPKHFKEIGELMKQICFYSYPHASHDPAIINLVWEILYLAAADALAQHNGDTIEENAFAIVCEYMEKHFSENITLECLAKKSGFSKEYFAREFKKRIGVSPINYLIQLRLDNAKEKLLKTNMSVQEIAYHCGYNSPSFFHSYFKEKIGYRPLEYRNIFRKTML